MEWRLVLPPFGGASHWRSRLAQDFAVFFETAALGLPVLSPAEYFAKGASQPGRRLSVVHLLVDMPPADGDWSHWYAREKPCPSHAQGGEGVGKDVLLQSWLGASGAPDKVFAANSVCVGMFGQAQQLMGVVSRQPGPDVLITRLERVMNPVPNDPLFLHLRRSMRYKRRLVALAAHLIRQHSLENFIAIHLRRGDFRLVRKEDVATAAQVQAALGFLKQTRPDLRQVFLASDGRGTTDRLVHKLLVDTNVRVVAAARRSNQCVSPFVLRRL